MICMIIFVVAAITQIAESIQLLVQFKHCGISSDKDPLLAWDLTGMHDLTL